MVQVRDRCCFQKLPNSNLFVKIRTVTMSPETSLQPALIVHQTKETAGCGDYFFKSFNGVETEFI